MACDLRQPQSWLQMASAREIAAQAKLDAKVDALTQGLAHPLRRSILYYLADEANGDKRTSPNELSKALDEPPHEHQLPRPTARAEGPDRPGRHGAEARGAGALLQAHAARPDGRADRPVRRGG